MNLKDQITGAYNRINPHILNTPLLHSPYLSAMNNGAVYLKMESEQHTGSFKARGALNKVLSLSEVQRAKGLITASTGNHAQGFARALTIAHAKGTIYMPVNADKGKIEALGYYDVKLEFYGTNSLEAELYAKEQAEKQGAIWVSPYNDWDVVFGQGTIALEIEQSEINPDAILGCIGGGGLMSGVCGYVKETSPNVRAIGCLPENSPEMYLSVKAGKVVMLDEYVDTLSDGSAGGLEEGSITFELCKKYVDDYLLASEDDIGSAIKFMVDKHHKIIEGAAGVAVSCFMKNAQQFAEQTVVIIICGGNIATEKLKTLL